MKGKEDKSRFSDYPRLSGFSFEWRILASKLKTKKLTQIIQLENLRLLM